MSADRRNWLKSAMLSLVAVLVTASVALGQGAVLPGVGPVNRSMAGAAVAAPLDPAGAIYWNPATTTGLANNEVMFGAEFLYTTSRLSSTVGPNAFGPGIPALALAGNDRSDGGVSVLPTIAIVYRPEESNLTYGLGIFVVGGFFSNYPGDTNNPILSPHPPTGLGAGPIFSNFYLLQMAPSVAIKLTDNISIGVSPTIDAAQLQVDPAIFVSPDDANGDGVPTYPAATHTRLVWGLGFQVGVYYKSDCGFGLGASFKSPQWFEPFRWSSTDEIGRPRQLRLNAQFPMIMSVGASYTGIENLTLAVDVRWIDYKDADEFGDPAQFDATGRAMGLGWRSVFAVAAGAQYQVSETMSFRMGYLYDENAIRDDSTFFTLPAAPIFQHAIFLGASYQLARSIEMAACYLHAFRNSISGPFQSVAGPVAGTNVSISQLTDSAVVGFRVKF